MTPPDSDALGGAIRVALSDLEALDRCRIPDARSGIELPLQKLRTLYLLAVEDPDRIDPARSEIERLEKSSWGQASDGTSTLAAYRGALEALEARHAFWPHTRLRHLRSGMQALHDAVDANPRAVEPRYLRLVSTAFLPRFLGQSGTVEEDLGALALLLPEMAVDFPRRTFEAMSRTVIDLLDDGAAERKRLDEALLEARRLDRPLAPGCSAA